MDYAGVAVDALFGLRSFPRFDTRIDFAALRGFVCDTQARFGFRRERFRVRRFRRWLELLPRRGRRNKGCMVLQGLLSVALLLESTPKWRAYFGNRKELKSTRACRFMNGALGLRLGLGSEAAHLRSWIWEDHGSEEQVPFFFLRLTH